MGYESCGWEGSTHSVLLDTVASKGFHFITSPILTGCLLPLKSCLPLTVSFVADKMKAKNAFIRKGKKNMDEEREKNMNEKLSRIVWNRH